MFLKNIAIRHYKSLASVDVDFSPLTIIVGPNGAGKSNFIDALKFFRDIVTDKLDHAVISREGIDRLRQKYKSKPFNIGLDLYFEPTRSWELPASYEFVLSGKEGDYRVEREAATYQIDKVLDEDNELIDVVEPQTFERKKDGSVLVDGKPLDRRARNDAVALGTPVGPFEILGGSIADFAKSWHFCSLYPNTLRALRPPTKDTQLAEDGSNWASVVRAMKKTRAGKESLEKISDAMRIAVAGYTDISVETAGSYLVPRISMRTRSDGTGASHKFDPVQLSDGTLRVFGILLALYQDPAPGLLVVEEPEQTIHPGALPVLADAFREASLRTQVVVTTHSPQFVDQFGPDEIRVAWMTEGQTSVSSIKASQIASVKGHLMSLGEFMLAEGLLPEPVDA